MWPAPKPLALGPRPGARFDLLGGKQAEGRVLYRITGAIDLLKTAGRLSGSHIEFSGKASEALARVRR